MWYEVELQPDDNETLLVTSSAFPELTTFGVDRDDALAHAVDALEEVLAARIDYNEAIPAPADQPIEGRHFVQLPLLSWAKVALYATLRHRDMSRAELMRKLGWHREQVDRLFRLDHNSRLDQLEAAFLALGVTPRLDIPFPAAA